MGSTHYWSFGPFIEEKAYKTALKECRKIVKACRVPLGNAAGEGLPTLNDGVWFNGVGADGHETFALGRIPLIEYPNFCKTARKPYDRVVTACLCVLHEHLGKGVQVTSDGDPHEWEAGRALASEVLGRDIKIPQIVLDQKCMYGWAAKQYRAAHPEYNYTPLFESHTNRNKEVIPEWAK